MEYNTAKEKLVIREYGRNIQSLIRYAITEEDREKRNQIAEYIIEMMSQTNPNMKNIEEYRRKLWDHLFLISDFKLDVDSPYPKPEGEEEVIPKVKEKMPYPVSNIRHKHYGKNVETMINKAREMDDDEKQKEYTEVIGNYMKMVYNTWNRDSINDEIIIGDLERMSKGELSIDDRSNLDALAQSNRRKKRPSTRPNTRGSARGSNTRNKSNNSGRRSNRRPPKS